MVLFLHLTFLKTWFDGLQRFQQRRPLLFPLVLRPRPPRFSDRHGYGSKVCLDRGLILGSWRHLQGKSGTVNVTC